MKNNFLNGLFAFVLLLSVSCNEEEGSSIPMVETQDVTNISYLSATLSGTVISEQGAAVTDKGIFYGTINDEDKMNKARYKGEGDDFSMKISGLKPNVQYYYCAYAYNDNGIAYGEVKSFTTVDYNYITDFDGYQYKTLPIGSQQWMVENLRTTHYNNGDEILTTDIPGKGIGYMENPKYQWVYQGNDDLLNDYGRLYTWYAIVDDRNVCPQGWHVPSIDEYHQLVDYIGGPLAGLTLKENGSDHWGKYNAGSDRYGFSARGAGYRTYDGVWDLLKVVTQFWSATSAGQYTAPVIELGSEGSNVYYRDVTASFGLSVRCVKDE
nr:FISUMP domain-containing protein [uncultured Carboxylicivirga sp.]